MRKAVCAGLGLAAGAAIGATALFAPSAQAASFEVNTVADAAADGLCDANCTLRDAVELANANGEADTITFLSGLGSYTRLPRLHPAFRARNMNTLTRVTAASVGTTETPSGAVATALRRLRFPGR